MLLRGIVKEYTADLILLTKFKKIIGIKKKFAQNMEVPVSIMKFLLQTQGSFGGFFCLKYYIFWWFLGEHDFQSSFFWFLGDKIRNLNVLLWMGFRKCVSANVFPICISGLITLVRQGYEIHNQFGENCYCLVIGSTV